MLRIVFAVLALVFATGPVRAQIPIIIPNFQFLPAGQPCKCDNIKTVAVISALGQNMNKSQMGWIRPRNENVDIRHWNLDDKMVAAITRHFGDRFEVKNVSRSRSVGKNT